MSKDQDSERTWMIRIREQGYLPAVTQVGTSAEKLPLKLRESSIVAAIAHGVIKEDSREKIAVSGAIRDIVLQMDVISPGLGGGYKLGIARRGPRRGRSLRPVRPRARLQPRADFPRRQHHLMQLGPYQVQAIVDGYFALDGGAMFGVVPRVVWQKTHPPDDRNRVRSRAAHAPGARGGAHAPGGHRHRRKVVGQTPRDVRHRVRVGPGDRAGRPGIAPADVTDVVVTHLHFDHAGGAVTRTPEGVLEPTYPNATF